LYAARIGLTTLLVEQMAAGGQILNVEKIENFPGFPDGIAGFDLGPIVQEQAEKAGAEFKMDTVNALTVEGGMRVVGCESGEDLQARAVIMAAGSTFRELGIPGEREFLGRGVSHCASCDAPLFVGKRVCVVGGGDSALDEAAVLASSVEHVTVIHRGSAFSAQQVAIERLNALANVEPRFNTRVAAIVGDKTVHSLQLDTGEPLQTHGVFVFVGLEPNTTFLQGVVELDTSGHITVDQRLQTSVPGVFAAGDIRQASARQLVSAAGDGASAAVFAAEYLAAL
jgi:thioredoxin reductase (NADPH)